MFNRVVTYRLLPVLVLALLLALAMPPGEVHAATIIVDTTDDELNSDGDCSLREAIQAANNNSVVDACTAGTGDNTITLPAGTYTLAMAVGGPGGSVQAATIVVNSTADVIADDGQCTLREAIIAVNNDTASGASGGECAAGSGDDTITLPFGFYQLSIPGITEGFSATGDLDIRTNMTISGAGPGTVVDGGGLDRVFEIGPAGTSGVVATISGVTIRNGVISGGLGAGIINNSLATLVLTDSVMTMNNGSGMRNGGFATLNRVVVSGNSDRGIVNTATVNITDSSIIDNSSVISGEGESTYLAPL